MKQTEQAGWIPVTEVSMLPLKEGRRVVCGQNEAALFNLGGECLAIGSVCPHKGGPLADGIVAGKDVFCPLHNWKISLETGQVIGGGEGQVATYPVKVVSGKVLIQFEGETA